MPKLCKSRMSVVLMSLLFPFVLSAVHAQQTQIAESTPQELVKQAREALAQEKFLIAADFYVRLAKLEKTNVDHFYNAACAFAMAGQVDSAFLWLDKSIQNGYNDLDHLKKDTDLRSLNQDARWGKIVDSLNAKIRKDARLWDSEVWKIPYSDQLSEEQRIAGLAKLWSEVKYGFVFTQTLKEIDWDAQFLNFLPRVKAARSTDQYYRELMTMAALLKDGHTRVIPPKELLEQSYAMPLLRATVIEDRVILTEVADELLRSQGLRVGMEVFKVNNVDVKTYLQENVAPLLSASTSQDMQRRLYQSQFLMGPLTQKIMLTVQDQGGKSSQWEVTRYDMKTRAQLMPSLPAFSWRMLDDQVAYVALNSFANETVARDYLAAFPDIAKAKAMIIDLRKNGGGNGSVGYKILSTLADRAFDVGASTTRDYKPAMRAWGRPETPFTFETRKIPADTKFHFDGKVVVLSSAQTYSAAEDFLLAFDTMKRGRIVGEVSGGSTGQPLVISLPGGGMATIVSKHDTYPDGKAFVGVGIQVDQQISPKLKDFRSNRDTVLEAAIQALR